MEEGITHLREKIIAGLQRYALPFTTVQPGSGFDDLMPLKQVIGDARIVALGEATHGTREFFLMKHRLLEFLVKEMHFTLFAIEATWAEANLINDYVHTGKGDPAQLLAGLYFWTWNTQEVLDMILWMRAHNEAPGNAPTISFRGFDMQSFRLAMENVLTSLHEVVPEVEEEVKTLFAPFQQYTDRTLEYSELPLQTRSEYRANLQRVYDLLLEHRATYEALSSREQFAHALQSARIVMQAESMFASEEHESRDQYMAENVSWLLEQAEPEAKIVLWAHNGHIGEESGDSMGYHLRQRYGDAMITFGFSFYQGSFHAVDYQPSSESRGMLISHETPPPPEESYEHMLGAVGLPQLFLNLREMPADSAVADWLSGPHLVRSIGAVYSAPHYRNFFSLAHLPKEYDVLIHLQDTTPSVLLSSVNRQKKRVIQHMQRQPRNLNFEAGWTGWYMTGDHPQDYERRLEHLGEGQENGCVSFASKGDEAPGFGALAQMIMADEYRGKQLRMAADVKSKEIEQWAGLWMRVDGPDGQSQSFDNMQDRAIKGTSDWTRYEIVLPVFEESQAVVFGILLCGKGQLWLRNVHIEVIEQ